MVRRYGRGVVAVIGALVAAVALTAPAAARPSDPAFAGAGSVRAVTGACQSVGGGPSTSAGPQRATVVIDTGTGPVWSACVSFSGSISGIEALARAQSVITDLTPVYDLYAGEGRAVCRLRGVGTDPPDCLGKSVDYWSYFRNGVYAGGGAGTSIVHDGDVEGWRFGHGRAGPRAATQGTQAVAAPPPTAPAVVPPTSPGPPASVAPSAPAGPDGPPGSAPGPTAPGATTTTAPGATTSGPGAGSSSTSRSGANGTTVPGGGSVVAGAAAAGAATPPTPPASPKSGGGSSGSAIGFVAALAAVGAVGFVIRRRRQPAPV